MGGFHIFNQQSGEIHKMTYNENLIEKYKDYEDVIQMSYKANHNGKIVDVEGLVNPLKIDNRQECAPTDDQQQE